MLQLPYQADMRKRRTDASEANSGSLHLWLISHKSLSSPVVKENLREP